MRVKLRRGAAAAAFLAACVAVLQVGDATLAGPVSAPNAEILKSQAPFGMAAGTDHEFFVTHSRLIPIGRGSIRVPILMYHYIRSAPSIYKDRLGFNLSVTPENFNVQMNWLATNGYHPVDFNDLRAYFAGSAPLPSKPVVITFDDGYRDLYTTAYPILQSYNFKAVAYIVTSFVGEPRYVTAAQILEMDANGIEIASHTVDHADLARTSPYWANYELAASKKWLQRLVGHPVVDFAYPSGRFNAQTVAALQATGYDTAVTDFGGITHGRGDRYTWTRMRVGGGESMGDFILNLGPPEPWIDITAVSTRQAAP